MAISIGDALLKIGVDTKDVDKGMQGLGDSIKKHQKAIGIAMVAAGGTILAAGALAVKTYAQMGDEVAKMAKRTGFSTEALSELRHAAELSGASLAGIEKASRTLSGAITDASFGLETYVRAFASIGLAYEDLAELTPEEQFLKVMEALAGVEDETTRAAIAADLMGRSGTAMLPMLADGTEALNEMRQEAHDLGIVFDEEAAVKAEEMADAMTRIKGATSGLQMAIADKLIPVLMPLIDKVKDIITNMSAWMKAHPELTKIIVLGTAAFAALLVALGTFLLIAPGIIAAGPMIGLAMHAALGPIGLITLAIAGLIAIGVALYKNWDAVQLFFKKLWENMKIMFGEAVKFLVKTVLQPFLIYIDKFLGTIVRGIAKVVGIFNEDWAEAIENVADTMQNLDKEITDWADGLIDASKASKNALGEVQGALQETARVSEKTTGEMVDNFQNMADETISITDTLVTNYNATIGQLEDKIVTVTTVHRDAYPTAAEKAPTGFAGAGKEEQLDYLSDLIKDVNNDYQDKKDDLARAKEWYYATGTPASYDRYKDLQKTTTDLLNERTSLLQQKAGIQGLALGGIAMHPMLASIAERSPEAVIPLDKLNGMIGGRKVNIFVELDGRVIAKAIGQPLVDEIRLKTGVHI